MNFVIKQNYMKINEGLENFRPQNQRNGIMNQING